MTWTSYVALVDVHLADVDADGVMQALDLYDVALAPTAHGTVDVLLTVEAPTLVRAVTSALALVGTVAHSPRAVHVMPADDFDERLRVHGGRTRSTQPEGGGREKYDQRQTG